MLFRWPSVKMTTLTFSVSTAGAPGGAVVNTATIDADALPGGAVTVSASTLVMADVDLSPSTKTAPTEVATGEPINYVIHIINSGDAAASNVVLTDPIPAGTTYVVGSVTGGCSYIAGQIEGIIRIA